MDNRKHVKSCQKSNLLKVYLEIKIQIRLKVSQKVKKVFFLDTLIHKYLTNQLVHKHTEQTLVGNEACYPN